MTNTDDRQESRDDASLDSLKESRIDQQSQLRTSAKPCEALLSHEVFTTIQGWVSANSLGVPIPQKNHPIVNRQTHLPNFGE